MPQTRGNGSRPRLLALLLMTTAACFGAFASRTLPSARAVSVGCPNVIFIGARGSGEKIEASSHGLGPAVNTMANAMNTALGAHGLVMRTFADPYPADPVSDLYPSRDEAIVMATALAPAADAVWAGHVHKYFKSIDTGVADAISAAEQDVAKCPGTALVFAGYSQGAMVMHHAELKLAASHETNVLNHIVGTLLLGDGDRVPNTKAKQFGTSKHGEGVRTYLYGLAHLATHDVESPDTTANICDEDDIICEFDPKRLLRDHNPFAIVAAFEHAGSVHTHYATTETRPLNEAADWLASKIIAADSPVPTPPPPLPPPPPTPAQPSSPPDEGVGVVVFPGGPLTVSVGQLGQCQSSYEGNDNYFPPDGNIGDCGFFLAFPATGVGQPPALQGSTWGFEGAAGPRGLKLYTPVSQSPVTGSGTASDPYTEVSVFKVLDYEGNQDALITETTTYIDGATQFTSTYSVKNTTTGPLYFRAIYAGDLYVGGDDFGAGVFEDGPPRFVGGHNPTSGAIGGFLETTGLPWSSFEEGCWNDTSEEDDAEADGRCVGAEPSDYGIWHTLETSTEEPRAFNELTDPAEVDNALGVEWDQLREAGLPAGQEQAFKITNVYRP